MDRSPMRMADWMATSDGILSRDDRAIFIQVGKIAHDLTHAHAGKHFEKATQQKFPKPRDQRSSPEDRNQKEGVPFELSQADTKS